METFLNKLSVFVLLTVLQHTKAENLKEGPCPQVKPMKNFNATKFNLLWYDFAKTPIENAPESKCSQYQANPPQYNIWPVSQFWVDTNGKKYNYTGNYTITGKGIGKTAPSQSDYTHLQTDYRSYAAIYTCQNQENNMHNGTKDPDQNTIQFATVAFQNNGLKLDKIRFTDLSDCPDNWDGAEQV